MRWIFDLFVRQWTLKLTALVLAFLLWFAVRSETPGRAAIAGVEVEVDLQDPGWVFLPPPRPDTVTVGFEGTVRELTGLALDRPRLVVPVTEVRDSLVVVPLELRFLRFRAGRDNVRPVAVEPATVTLRFDRIRQQRVPVAVVLRGAPPRGLRLSGPPRPTPAAVQVTGPSRLLAGVDSLRLVPIDLSTLPRGGAVSVPVDTTGLGRLTVAPATVEVVVPVQAAAPDTVPADTAEGTPPDTAAGASTDTVPPAVDDTAPPPPLPDTAAHGSRW